MVVKLGDICSFQSGGTPSRRNPEYFSGNIPWITTTALNGKKIGRNDAVALITEQAVAESAAKIVPAGSIMVGTRVGVGKVAINTEVMSTSQDIISLLNIDENVWDKEFLCKFLQSKSFFLNSQARGATIKGIKIDVLSELDLPVMSKEEQTHISEIVDNVKKLISIRQQQLEKLDELVKARFVEMFGDPLTNPKGYQEKYLSEIAEYWNGLTYKPDDVANEGTIVLRSSNIQNASLDFADTVRVNCKIGTKKYVQDNDILMCSRNGSAKLVGKVALIKELSEPMSFGAFMMIIRSAYYPFLMTYFQLPAFRSQITTGATTTINQITGRMLDNVKLAIPDIESVKDFSAFTNQVDKSKAVEGLYSSLCL